MGVCCLALVVTLVSCSAVEAETIKVGILHSQTGTLATSERPVADATMMAIDEINESGGVLGRQIEPVFVDARPSIGRTRISASGSSWLAPITYFPGRPMRSSRRK